MKRRGISRRLWLNGVLLVALLAMWLPASATPASSDSETARLEGCHFGLNFVPVAKDKVAGLVPDHYRLLGEDTANLLVDPFACDNVVAGDSQGPAEGAFISVDVCPLDGTDCSSGIPESYVLFLVTDSKAFADWMRAGSGLSVRYDPKINEEKGFCPPAPCRAGEYKFVVPGPPGPFTVEGVMGAQPDVEGDDREGGVVAGEIGDGGWIQDTRTPDGKHWTARLTYGYHDDFFAPADVTITAEKGSEMYRILGGEGADETSEEPFLSVPKWIPEFELTKTVTRGCLDTTLDSSQRGVLKMLRLGTGDTSDDLTTLDDESDLNALATLGYNFYPHRQSSIKGMGWPVLDTFTDPAAQTAARPQLLLYEPGSPDDPSKTVTRPDDGFDFPYRLRGWAYPPLWYKLGQHPTEEEEEEKPTIPGLARFGEDGTDPGSEPDLISECSIGREAWFVHERGIHTFDDGDFDPYPPEEELRGEAPHGTTPGDDTVSLTPSLILNPGDFPHARSWDLHVWCSPDCVAPKSTVPTVSMLNPGTPIPGLDPNVGVSPPRNWPNPPYPSFFFPPPEPSE